MKRTLVLKRLSSSDLTIFESQYKHTTGAKQKGVNLDKAVFLGQLYPNLRDRLATGKSRIPLELHIYGPGGALLHSQQRKILLQAKNIRLNGEFIKNPLDEPGRYDSLEKDDLAIIEFVGDDAPSTARLFLIARNIAADVGIHQALIGRFGNEFSDRKAMHALDDAELSAAVQHLNLTEDHPLLDFIDEDALEDAAQGGLDGIKKLRRRRKSRGVSPDELERAKRNAERNGRLGEELLNAWLTEQVEAGVLARFEWVSDSDAVAPYDFVIHDAEGREIRVIDAKSTTGEFANRIHISVAELEESIHGERPYDIYRLYGLGESVAKFRVAENVGEKLKPVLDILRRLPEGIQADGVSINPDILSFGETSNIDIREPDDSEESSQAGPHI